MKTLGEVLDKYTEWACNQVDSWPDYKLDTFSLNSRNNRRAKGEILPNNSGGVYEEEQTLP